MKDVGRERRRKIDEDWNRERGNGVRENGGRERKEKGRE